MSKKLQDLQLQLSRTKTLYQVAPWKYKASGADMLDIEQKITELEKEISAEERKGGK